MLNKDNLLRQCLILVRSWRKDPIPLLKFNTSLHLILFERNAKVSCLSVLHFISINYSHFLFVKVTGLQTLGYIFIFSPLTNYITCGMFVVSKCPTICPMLFSPSATAMSSWSVYRPALLMYLPLL